jgi:uncharacterized NAD-dependent epimerase/dehydratase family protein
MALWKKLGIVAAIPAAGVAPGTGAAVDAFRSAEGNVLEITGTNSAAGAAATLTLLRWCIPNPGSGASLAANGEWRIWLEDRPIVVPAAPSQFSARYEHPEDETNYWLLLSSIPVATLLADVNCVHYRGRK